MAESRPGNQDRGWNDPPMFDYQGSVTASHFGTGTPQHTKLNKRVAYPMSPSSPSPAPTGTATLLNPSEGPPRLPPIQILPPVSTTSTPTPLPLLVPTLSPTTDPTQPAMFSVPVATASAPVGNAAPMVKVKDLASLLADLSLESEESLLKFVKDGLISAMELVKDAIQGRVLEDVKKKLVLMEECWNSGSLSEPVKSQMGSLVAALKKEEIEEAHELHLALMINHTPEVHHWLVGVKHIIGELRAKGAEVNPGEEEADSSAVDPCMTLLVQNVPMSQPPPPENASLSATLQAKDVSSQDASESTPSGDREKKDGEESAAGSS